MSAKQFTQIGEPYSDTFLLGDFTLELDVGGALLTSITSLTHRDVEVVRDASALGGSVSFSPFGAPEAGYTLDFPLVDATAASGLTHELRFAGEGERVDWVLGTFYSTSERQYGQSAYAENYVAVNGPAVTDFLRVVTGVPDLLWSGSRALDGRSDTEELFFSDLKYDFDQLALFGEASVALTDRLSLTGGLRWYDFEEARTQVFAGLFADPLDSEGTTTATGVAPRIIASYDVTAATQVNAQVSKGFRLGGINDPLNTPICSPEDLATFGDRDTWEDEELWNYEAGVKSTFLGGRGTFNASGLLHGRPQPAGDGDGRHLLVADYLQRAGRPQRRRGAGAGRATDHVLRLRGVGQHRRRPAAVDDHVHRRRRRDPRGVGHRGRASACRPRPASRPRRRPRGAGWRAAAGSATPAAPSSTSARATRKWATRRRASVRST